MEKRKTLEDVATQNIIAINKEVVAKYKLLLALFVGSGEQDG